MLFLFSFLVLFSCTGKSSGKQTPAVTEARVEYSAGDVLVDDKKIKIGDEIKNRSIITTGDDGICEIIFNDKNIIKILENTNFKLDFSGVVITVTLKQGTLINVLKKLAVLTDSESLTVNTPTAVLGVRGTSFFVKADADSTYVCVCNGVVTVMDKNKTNPEEVRAKHHVARLITKSDQGIKVSPAEMLYHTDEDIEKAAEKIGYKISWDKIE